VFDLRRDLDLAHLGGGGARPVPPALPAINRDLELEPLEHAETCHCVTCRRVRSGLLSFFPVVPLPCPFCAVRPTMRLQADGDLTVVEELPDDTTAARANPPAAKRQWCGRWCAPR